MNKEYKDWIELFSTEMPDVPLMNIPEFIRNERLEAPFEVLKRPVDDSIAVVKLPLDSGIWKIDIGTNKVEKLESYRHENQLRKTKSGYVDFTDLFNWYLPELSYLEIFDCLVYHNKDIPFTIIENEIGDYCYYVIQFPGDDKFWKIVYWHDSYDDEPLFADADVFEVKRKVVEMVVYE